MSEFKIVEELADPQVRLAVEEFYGWQFAQRTVLNDCLHCESCEKCRLLNARSMNELGGLLERTYTKLDGASLADAHEDMRDARGAGRQDCLAGRAFVDRLMPAHRASAHVIVVDREPTMRILTQDRDDVEGVASRGMSSIPGGKVEDGESAHDAALRELEEETALEPKHLVGGADLAYAGSYYEVRRAKRGWRIWRARPAEVVRRYLFRADILAGMDKHVRCREGRAMAFRTLDEIRTLDLTVVAAEALEPYLRAT